VVPPGWRTPVSGRPDTVRHPDANVRSTGHAAELEEQRPLPLTRGNSARRGGRACQSPCAEGREMPSPSSVRSNDCAFACDPRAAGGGSCPNGYSCRPDGLCKRNGVADDAVCRDVAAADAAVIDGVPVDAPEVDATDAPRPRPKRRAFCSNRGPSRNSHAVRCSVSTLPSSHRGPARRGNDGCDAAPRYSLLSLPIRPTPARGGAKRRTRRARSWRRKSLCPSLSSVSSAG
jgi:hypothetical protein